MFQAGAPHPRPRRCLAISGTTRRIETNQASPALGAGAPIPESPGSMITPRPRIPRHYARKFAGLLLLLQVSFTARAQQADVNIALGRPVSASAATWSGQVPENLTDGVLNNQTHPLASSGTLGFVYEIDLGREANFDRIILHNRSGCCPERLSDYRVTVFADGGAHLEQPTGVLTSARTGRTRATVVWTH